MKISKLLVYLTVFLTALSCQAGLIELPDKKLDSPQDVQTINSNFHTLDSGKLNNRPYSVIPATGSYYNLGSTNTRWNSLYANNLYMHGPSPWFDVKAYGATGNASTDDTAAIQSVFDACVAIAGCTIFFPAGIYKITSEITYVGSAVDVIGEGPDRSVIKAATASQNMFHFSNGGSGSIKRMGFSYQVIKTTGSAIYFDVWGSAEISNVKTVGQWMSIRGENSNFLTVKDCTLEPTTATTSVGILINGGIEQYLTDIIINGDTTNQPKAGVEVTSTGGIYFNHVECNHDGIGILMDPHGTDQVNPIFMNQDILDSNNSGAGIKICPDAAARVGFLKATNESWSSNGVVGGGYGLDLDCGGIIVDIRVSNSNIQNNGSHGIHQNAGTDIYFDGNAILGNSQSSLGTYSDAWVAAGSSKFAYIGNRMGTSAGFASTQEKYGLEIATGGSTQYQVIGNNFYTTVIGGLWDGGTGTEKQVFGNVPFESNASLHVSSANITTLFSSTITAATRIGIGTQNPQRSLHVVGAAGAIASFPTVGANSPVIVENNSNSLISFIGSAAGVSGLSFFKNNVPNAAGQINYANSTDAMTFTTTGTVRMTISSGGNVTVAGGTTGNGTVPSDTYSIAQLQTSTPTALGAVVVDNSLYDLWVGTGISAARSWRNTRTGVGP